jgi:hypothetical protein
MPTPQSADIALQSWMITVRPEAENLTMMATGATPEEAIRSAAPMLLQASPPPTMQFEAPFVAGAVPPDPNSTVPVFKHGPGRPPKTQ